MGLFSPGSKWKRAAEAELRQAQNIEGVQRDVEFQRGLLSNIRQQRMAQAQLSLMNYSDTFTSSSASGASANIDSALAGEMTFSFDSSERMQSIQDHQQKAQEYMQKYAKQQKTRATAFAVTGIAAAVLTGGALGMAGIGAGATAAEATAAAGGGALAQFGSSAWASLGAYGSLGQGIGQIASGTGQTDIGIKNVLSGAGEAYSAYKGNEYKNQLEELLKRYQTPNGQIKTVTGGIYG